MYREATWAALIGLVANLGLGLAKLIGGWIGGSFALISDSVNSLGDVVATVVVLYALRVAQQPPDSEHPYGHTRAEGIAATNVALLIGISALTIGWEAIQRLTQPQSVPPFWTLWIAGSNIVIKEVLYRYKRGVGLRTGSAAMIANALDHRADAFCAAAVLVGLALMRWGGPEFGIADPIASLIVAIAILWSAVDLFRNSALELMDAQADDPFVNGIRQAAASVDGVKGVEKLWVRKSGLEYFADIHLEVDSHLTVADGHEIGHRAKDRLLADFPALRDVIVHLEPFPHVH